MHLLAGYVSTELTQLTGKAWKNTREEPAIETALAYVSNEGDFLTTAFLFREYLAMALAKSLYNFIPDGYGKLRVMVAGNPAEKSGKPYEIVQIDAERKPKPKDIKMFPEIMNRGIAVIKVICTEYLYLIQGRISKTSHISVQIIKDKIFVSIQGKKFDG